MTAWPAPPDWARNLFTLEGYELVRTSTPGSWYMVKHGRRYKAAYTFTSGHPDYLWYVERVQIWSDPLIWEFNSVPFKR